MQGCGAEEQNFRGNDLNTEDAVDETSATLLSGAACSGTSVWKTPKLEVKQVGNLVEMSWCVSTKWSLWISSPKGAVMVGNSKYRAVGNQRYAKGNGSSVRIPLGLAEFSEKGVYKFWVHFDQSSKWSKQVRFTPKVTGDVDGDGDFDANDGNLMVLAKLGASASIIDSVKGPSLLAAPEIRLSVQALDRDLRGDVDGDGDFDSTDANLITLIRLSVSDSIFKHLLGPKTLSAAQVRQNVANLQ